MVQHFQEQCVDMDKLVARSSGTADSLPMSCVEDAIVQIEDMLYYFSDVISSGIPDLERFITENILQVLVFRFLLPSLQRQSTVSAEKHFTYYLIYFCVGFLFLIFYYNFFL